MDSYIYKKVIIILLSSEYQNHIEKQFKKILPMSVVFFLSKTACNILIIIPLNNEHVSIFFSNNSTRQNV